MHGELDYLMKQVLLKKEEIIDLDTYQITKDTKLFAIFESHKHKICGVASDSVCTHTLVTDTHSEVEWTPVENNNGIYIAKNQIRTVEFLKGADIIGNG